MLPDEHTKQEDCKDLAAAGAGGRTREREHRTRSEILSEALRRYLAVAERDRMIPVEEALREEIETMHRADEEYARGECVRLGDLQRDWELNLAS
jgi:hypothetical protein